MTSSNDSALIWGRKFAKTQISLYVFLFMMITGASLTLAVASHKPPGSHKKDAQQTVQCKRHSGGGRGGSRRCN